MRLTRNENEVIRAYSRHADAYDSEENQRSCWGQATAQALTDIHIDLCDGVVVDVGCGSGRALRKLADEAGPAVHFIGVEPAEGLRRKATEITRDHPNIRIVDGCFESLPLETQSVDYLFSLMAFHWTTDLKRSVTELARVLKPGGDMDLFFIGRHNGREFIRKTTPIFLKYMGAQHLLESAALRTHLTRDAATELFKSAFPDSRVEVGESYKTYHDTLSGHWHWWVRIEGQFISLPAEHRQQCDRDVHDALAELQTGEGIPYTIHLLHVRVGS